MFSLSLARNFQTDRIADFGRVEGLPGVYLANQLGDQLDPSTKPRDLPWSNFLQTKVSIDMQAQHVSLQQPGLIANNVTMLHIYLSYCSGVGPSTSLY